MFELPLIQSSTHMRAGGPQLLAEFVATFGLLLVVLGQRRGIRPVDVPWFILAQIVGALIALGTAGALFSKPRPTPTRIRTLVG
jgi:glycerol uptake facilitator-like aquaporin